MFQPAPIALLVLALAQVPAAAPEIERLTHLAKLWGTVRYLHPYLAYREEIDWDAALIQAIPRVRSAKTSAEYAAAVQTMLAALGDPVTRVLPPEPLAAAKPEPAAEKPLPPLRWLNGQTLVVDLRSYAGYGGFRALFRQFDGMEKEIGKARTVVVDLRPATAAMAGGGAGFQLVLNRLAPFLIHRPVRAPTQRYRLTSGYPSQDGMTAGIYWSGFVTLAAEGITPATPKGPDRVAFLVSPRTELPAVALALQASGDGVLVSQDEAGAQELAEESLVVSRSVDLGEGLTAQVRASELVPLPGWRGVHADARIAAGTSDEAAVRAAIAAIDARRPSSAAAVVPLPDAVWRADKTYPEMLDPSLEVRLLAVVRAWNVIHYFDPHKALMGDWDAVLPEFLARMEEVRGARGYAETVAEMMARLADGHTEVSGHPELDRLYGEAGVDVLPRWIEGKWVVVGLGDDPAARASGLRVGDVIAAVDGEPAQAKIERLRRVISASNEGGFRETVRRLLLDGAEGSTAVLSIAGGAGGAGRDGATREVKLPRARKYAWLNLPAAKGEVVRLLPGNLGYVDLTRLEGKDVDAMFETLRATRGIIFDMRGYPKGIFGRLAPRLNTRNARFAASYRGPEVSAFVDEGEEAEAGHVFSQPIYETEQWKYTGRTVMLIDERAISQAEHTGLFLEAANGTKLVGTPTAGADGEATTFTLPGNIRVGFTGHDVRHADGRQLQGIGLTPDVEVAPTIQGIRDGRDEVLERAVRYLEEALAH